MSSRLVATVPSGDAIADEAKKESKQGEPKPVTIRLLSGIEIRTVTNLKSLNRFSARSYYFIVLHASN
jgi:hypothetical protein